MIEWKLNDKSYTWARREGRALCSSRDPVNEAVAWVSSLGLSGKETEIAVVGVGTAQHLFELRRQHPKIRLLIFDSHEIDFSSAPAETASAWDDFRQTNVQLHQGTEATDFAAITLVRGPVVLFRSACSATDFEIHARLLGQDARLFAKACETFHFPELKSAAQAVPANLAVNIKSLAQGQLPPSSTEEKMLSVLRELVR